MCNVDADCDCNTPFCNTDQGRCVKCKGNDDCDRGVCNKRQGRCVECKVNDDCDDQDRPVCICNKGKCRECRSNDDCKTGDVCDWNDDNSYKNGMCKTLGQRYCTSHCHCRPTPGTG